MRPGQGSTLVPGDEVQVDGHRYQVEDTFTWSKTSLENAPIWGHDGRFHDAVLITCLQRSEGGRSQENVVAVLRLVPDEGDVG